MLGNYISKDTLPGDLLGNLEAVTINAGSSFLAGAATSSFSKVLDTADNVALIYNTAVDPNIWTKITKDLIEHCVTVTTNELTTYISDKTTELLSFDKIQNVLVDSITYWTKEKIISPAEILDILKTKNMEKENKKEMEKQQKAKINEIKTNITDTVGKMKDYADKTVSSLNAGIESITAYVTMGPDWVVTKANSYVGQAIEKVETFIGTQADFLIRSRDAAIDALGQGIGAMGAAVINRIAINTAKKVKSDAEGLISKVQVKAMNAITKAIMIVRQLTGIAIPPIYPPLPKLTSLF